MAIHENPRLDHSGAPRAALPSPEQATKAADHHEGGQKNSEHNAHDEIPKDLPHIRAWGIIIAAIVIVLCFAGLFILAWIPREKRIAEIHDTPDTSTTQPSKPIVQIVTPQHAKKSQDLVLPADARAQQETSIYPRANGYLKTLKVDIGDKVSAGQLLAEIDSPDVDADLAQAQAALGQSNANLTKAQNDLKLSDATYKRYQSFGTTGGVTQQQLDERESAFTQSQSAVIGAEANVKAAKAAVDRLVALQGFEKVVAPFAGTISARNFDLGALMASTSSGGRELFRIADTSTLRVFVNVPQNYVGAVALGQVAHVSVRSIAGREFDGVIARSAGVVDPTTRTLRFEIDVPNPDDVLKAGMYASARVPISGANDPLVVPTSALVFDSAGTKVWTVQGGKAHPVKILVGRDFGTEIEVAEGLKGGESVVSNPGERLVDGIEVQVPQAPAQADAQPQQQSSPTPQPQKVAER